MRAPAPAPKRASPSGETCALFPLGPFDRELSAHQRAIEPGTGIEPPTPPITNEGFGEMGVTGRNGLRGRQADLNTRPIRRRHPRP